MRTGEVLGVEHGVRWATWARQEQQSLSWGSSGGHQQWDGELGCWHTGCECALADPRHVLCLQCKSTAKEAPRYLQRMAHAVKNIQAALRWQPPKHMKTRIAQPTAPLLCPATRITIKALVRFARDRRAKQRRTTTGRHSNAYSPVTFPNPPPSINAQTGHSEN